MGNSPKNLLVWNHLLNKNKFWWNSHWMVLFQNCVRQFVPSTKMAPTPELSLTKDPMGNSHKNLLLRNHWANCNQTLVEWSLDGPLPKLYPVIPTSNQDGQQTKNRKKGGWNFKRIFSSETTEPISTKLCWNDPLVVPFQNCVQHFRPPTKMAATAELNLT